MGDLVVAEVVGIDDGSAAAHLADDEVNDHVLHDRGRAGLQEWEGHAAADAWLDVTSALTTGLEVLVDHSAHELGQATGEVVGVVEEQAERSHLQPLALFAQLAVGGDGACGPTADEVADAGTAIAQQVASRWTTAARSRRHRRDGWRPSGSCVPSPTSGRPGCRAARRGGCRPGRRWSSRVRAPRTCRGDV